MAACQSSAETPRPWDTTLHHPPPLHHLQPHFPPLGADSAPLGTDSAPLGVDSTPLLGAGPAPPLGAGPAPMGSGPAPMSLFQWQIQQQQRRLELLKDEELKVQDDDGDTFLHVSVAQGKRALSFVLAEKMSQCGSVDLKEHHGQCPSLYHTVFLWNQSPSLYHTVFLWNQSPSLYYTVFLCNQSPSLYHTVFL